jgi:hypothetical protein
MQGWQQLLVDDRGGADGQNFDRLVQASETVHEGANPATQEYSAVRTTRAILLGAAVFEIFCQEALIEQGLRPMPSEAAEVNAAEDIRTTLNRLPLPLQGLVEGYMASYQSRTEEDSSRSPSSEDTTYSFYEAAHSKLVDHYWNARIASGRFEPCTVERLERERERSKEYSYAVLSLLADNMSVGLDVYVAMGASLCYAKRQVCSSDELGEYFADNIDTATALTSVKRGPGGVLPFHYASRVIARDSKLANQPYIVADKEGNKYQARWRGPSLRGGKQKHPGHCPASDYNRLRPRTDTELSAVTASLASIGLEKLIIDGTITTAQLLLSKSFEGVKATVYQDDEWQSQFIDARNQ